MTDAEGGRDGEEGEEQNVLEELVAPPKPPSEVQIKLVKQGNYVAGKFDLIFSMLAKIEGDIIKFHETVKVNNEAIEKAFNDKLAFVSNRVLVIETERNEEKAAVEAAKRAAFGVPPEEVDPFEKFDKLAADLAAFVRANPSLLNNAVVKLEETLFVLKPPEAPQPTDPPPAEALSPPEEESSA